MGMLSGVSLPGGKEELKSDGSGLGARDDGILIQPDAGFVIKTRQMEGSSSTKLFINVCTHGAIAAPSTKKRLDADGKEREGTHVPVSVGPVRHCMDKSGRPSLAVDCIVNPSVLDETTANQDFLCQLVLQCIEKKLSGKNPKPIKVFRKYTLPKLSYQGWIDPFTGKTVDKTSENAQVAKQMVRDVSKRPTIQEVDSNVSNSQRSSSAKKSTSASEAQPADVAARPLERIPIEVHVEVSDGNVLPLFDFIERINSARADDAAKIDPTLSTDPSGSLFPSQLLQIPLLIDDSNSGPVKAVSIRARCKVTCSMPETFRLELSAYVLKVSAEGYGPTECVLPFPVELTSASSKYRAKTSTLSVEMSVSANAIDNGPDIGSHQWLLQKGLTSGKSKKLQPRTKSSRVPPKDDVAEDQLEAEADKSDGDDDVYPEDLFHAKDVFSQHMLQRQRDELGENDDDKIGDVAAETKSADKTSMVEQKSPAELMELF